MNRLVPTVCIVVASLAIPAASQTTPVISTFAGSGLPGSDGHGDGGPATQADLAYPDGPVAVDRWGNVFFTEDASRVRRVDAVTGLITTVAGGGTIPGPPDGTPAVQGLMYLYSVATDADGNVFLGEYGPSGALIRRVDAITGLLSTYAGGGTTTQFHQVVYPHPTPHVIWSQALPSGDGGPATSAYLADVGDMAFDAAGNLYFCDRFQVRRIDAQTGIISSAAGNGQTSTLFYSSDVGVTDSIVLGTSSGDGGPATSAGLEYPAALALDADGNLFIFDLDFISDSQSVSNLRVRRVDAQSGIITPYAGVGTAGFSGDGGPATLAEIEGGVGLTVDRAGNLYISDWNSVVRKVDAASGTISTVVGTPLTYGFGGDGGPASDALLNYPGGLAFDPAGNLYIVDFDNYRIRKVSGLNPDSPPTAIAGADQSIHAGSAVLLDGIGSFDDNTPTVDLTYQWSFVSVPAGSAAMLLQPDSQQCSFTPDLPGTYAVQLVVYDALNQPSQPSIVLVSSTNLAPAANAGPDLIAFIGALVTLDGAASSDPELDPLTYQWMWTAAPAGSALLLIAADTAAPYFVPDVAGVYTLSLIVDDGLGPSLADEVAITAVTGEQFAEITVTEVVIASAGLLPASVTSAGNQQAYSQLLTQVVQGVQSQDLARARQKLLMAIERTDGCFLRGSPDASGPGRDWILDCDVQIPMYRDLKDALDAISP